MYKTRMGRNFKVMVEFLQFWLAKKKLYYKYEEKEIFHRALAFMCH